MRFTVRDITVLSLLGAILVGVQVVLVPLPNIELVSLFVIVYTIVYGLKALYPVYIFVLLEGLIFGFGIWWISYLYIWTLLAVIALLCHKFDSELAWALVSGCFGLFFGALCAIPYLISGGAYAAFSYWVAGLGFDFIHCVSNFILALLLFKPLRSLLMRLKESAARPKG